MNEIADKHISSPTDSGLDAIFAPLTKEDFFASWFDIKPMRIAGKPDKFKHLPSVNDVVECIREGTPWTMQRHPDVYIDGIRISSSDLDISFNNMDEMASLRPNMARYEKLLDLGATIALFCVQNLFSSLHKLVSSIGEQTLAETEAYLFFSREACKGLAPHYDCVDILILQLTGSKRWEVSSQRADNPIKGTGTAVAYDGNAPVELMDMTPGDALYLPRGTFHSAIATSDISLHVTIPLRFATGYDLLRSLIDASSEKSEIRALLATQSKQELKADVERIMSVLTEQALSNDFLKRYTDILAVRSNLLGPQINLPDTETKEGE